MKNFQNKLILLLFIAFALPHFGWSQDSSTQKLKFEVNRNFPAILMTKAALKEAQTLVDLNHRYQSSWIKEYISVEVLTTHNGTIRKAASKSHFLTPEQKDNMNRADAGTDISVKVRYIPDNNLTHNDIQELDFTFVVNPENDAKYVGGQGALQQYLKENAIDKIPNGVFEGYDLAIVKFSVDEEGRVVDAHIFWPFKEEKIDALLLETICNMPSWKPAEFANGTTVQQEFVLTVGNHESCAINLLNIGQQLAKID